MGRPTRDQRIAHLAVVRGPLARRHARLEHPDRGSTRHDAWGVCTCPTAQRLRNNSVALCTLNGRPAPAKESRDG